MICKNPYCKSPSFVAVIEMDNNQVVGLKCQDCKARYSLKDVEIKKSLKRNGWNSAKWETSKC